jgi:hypothetical protein
MTKSANLRITVTPVRNRKPKVKSPGEKENARAFANELLNLLHNDQITNINNADVFVSVIATAIQDLHKVEN